MSNDNESELRFKEERITNGQKELVKSETVSLDEALAKAIELHQQDRRLEAQGIYNAILKIDPTHSGALHFLGVLFFQLSRHEDAIELIQLALHYNPEYIDALNNLGNIYQELKQFQDAEKAYRTVLETESAHVGAMNNLAAVLKAQGHYEEALTHYHSVLQLVPDNAMFHYNLGNAYTSAQEWQSACDAYSNAIRINPGYAIAYRELGGVLRALGQQEKSLDAFSKAAKADESQAEAHCQHAVALHTSGLVEDAVLAYLRAIDHDHTFIQIYPNLIVALNSLDLQSEAEKYVKQWRELDPESAAAIHMHASITGDDVPARATDIYVTTLFDDFSDDFDQKLQSLEYKAPQLLLDHCLKAKIISHGDPCKIIDAGCGTGLCGPLFREYATYLVGVDLSSGMLKGARQRNIYDELTQAELTVYLKEQITHCDLIISADTLVYFGDLNDVTNACSNILKNGGWLVFSVEKLNPEESLLPHRLNLNGRYSHTESYLKNTLSNHGFGQVIIAEEVLRQELGKPVQGFVVMAQKS